MNEKLFAPGPAECLPKALAILSEPIVYHRTDYFLDIFINTHQKLKQVFMTTSGETLIMNGSGTCGMDNAINNLFEVKEKVLVINVGNFGSRFTEICQVYGLEVIELVYEWGQTYKLTDITEQLKVHQDIKAIIVTHSETSTGALQAIQPLGELTKNQEILLIVDTISGLVMNEFLFDDWHVDVALSASQKGFMLPPGLNFTCLSAKAIAKAEKVKKPLYYNSYLRNLLAIRKHQILSTVNTPMICALDFVLDLMLAESLAVWQKNYFELYTYLETELLKLGFEKFCIATPSISLVCMKVPKNCKVNPKKLLKQNGIVIAGGMGNYIDDVIRIGVMNNITMTDGKKIIEILKDGINA